MLSYAKSATARTGDRLNGFKKGNTQQFNSGGVLKWAYFQKKWSIPLMPEGCTQKGLERAISICSYW